MICSGAVDLLTDDFEVDDSEKDDLKILNEILNAPTSGGDDFSREWQAVFGSTPLSPSTNLTPVESDNARAAEFMPSCLLDMTSGIGTPSKNLDLNIFDIEKKFWILPFSDDDHEFFALSQVRLTFAPTRDDMNEMVSCCFPYRQLRVNNLSNTTMQQLLSGSNLPPYITGQESPTSAPPCH